MNHTARVTRTRLAALSVGLSVTLIGSLLGGLAGSSPAAAREAGGSPDRPASYLLEGDADSPVGSKFEGIGADQRRGLFYVSEVTGGEIHRGSVHTAEA